MSLLSELNAILTGLDIPVETGVFSDKPPNEYVVITPLFDRFEVHADNRPQFEVQEARLSLFSKGNYTVRSRQITAAVLDAGFAVTERRYVGYENDTGYHHYSVDLEKEFSYMEGAD